MICTIYAPWFGCLPFYADYFLGCCARAKNIQWCVASDQLEPVGLPDNILWSVVSEDDCVRRFFSFAKSRKWGHKLCDLKPFWHDIFKDSREQKTAFRGWIDWDVYHDLSSLDFNFAAAKFTHSSLASPLFIARCDAALNVCPVDMADILAQTSSSAWDELFYLKHVDAVILQKGMTPEIDLNEPVKFAVHMYRAKHIPAMYDEWVQKYFISN